MANNKSGDGPAPSDQTQPRRVLRDEHGDCISALDNALTETEGMLAQLNHERDDRSVRTVLWAAHAAVTRAKQQLVDERNQCIKLEESLEASGEFVQEMIALRERVEATEARAHAAEQARAALQAELRRERVRANRSRRREITLLREIVQLAARGNQECLSASINELIDGPPARDAQPLRDDAGRQTWLFADVDNTSDEESPRGGGEDRGSAENSPDKKVRMLIRTANGREIRYPIYKEATTLGRMPDNDIQIRDNHVSACHAMLVDRGKAMYIEDLQSKNGVYVNASRVTNRRLKDGDRIRIGGTDFRFRVKKPTVWERKEAASGATLAASL